MLACRGCATYPRRVTHEPGSPERLFEAGADRAPYVREMFEDIAARYDLMNTLMTGGRHHAWRRAAALELVRPGDRIVDVGCGTGDLSFACLEAGARAVLGLDFALPMLEHAQRKARAQGASRATFALGDATLLPLASESVEGWCGAFVVRNIPDLDGAFAEARRVLKPGGRLAILEIPKLGPHPLRPAIRLHFSKVVPLLGRAVSGHASAYRYLPVSVDHFLTPPELTARLRGAGFEIRRVERFMLGTVALHVAERPSR
ncbi:MAG: ubiquinone/menaquinone biosynthesis methyltransferase [Dehalococcoidia bacterium]|nr:ubiquinone/menaquinone biosynthesis methyltransferase [Dehalococcoidia bacterium]